MASTHRLQERRAQHRYNGGCFSRSHPEVTQLSLLLYVSGASLPLVPPPEYRVSACKKANLYMGSLRGHLSLWQLSILSGRRNPLLFLHPDVMGALLPSTGALGWGDQYRVGTPCSSGSASKVKISLLNLNFYTWMWGQLVSHLFSCYLSHCGVFCIYLFIRLLFS